MNNSHNIDSSKKVLTVLGLDPGYVNFGWSVVKLILDDSSKLRLSIYNYGMLQETIQDMKDVSTFFISKYEEELNSIITEYKVELIAMERYQSRGFKGISAELVNVMIGICLSKFKSLPCVLLTPSQWKNAARRNSVDLKSLYRFYHKDLKPHEIDAAFIAMYSGFTFFDLDPLTINTATVKYLLDKSKQTIKRQSIRIGQKPIL